MREKEREKEKGEREGRRGQDRENKIGDKDKRVIENLMRSRIEEDFIEIEKDISNG